MECRKLQDWSLLSSTCKCVCMCVNFRKQLLKQMIPGLNLQNKEFKHTKGRSEGIAKRGRGMSEDVGLLNCGIRAEFISSSLILEHTCQGSG